MADYKKELEEFLYILSHDFQAPVRHIGAFSKLLTDEIGDDLSRDADEYAYHLQKSAEKLECMMRAFVCMARIDAHDIDIIRVDFKRFIDEMAIEAGLAPDVIILKSSTSEHISVDEELLRIIFFEILKNAAVFKAPSQDLKLEVDIDGGNGAYSFSIKDNGIGLNERYHDKAFKLFWHLNRGDDLQRIGKGLALVKKVIQKIDGSLSITSEEGSGFCITLTWPKI